MSKIQEHLHKIVIEQAEYRNSIDGSLKYYDCPICKNRGYTWFADDMLVKSKVCECMPKRKINERLFESGLANEFKRYRLDNFEHETPYHQYMYDKAIKFIDNPTQAIYYGGQVGSGKSHICTAISRALIEKGYAFDYLKYADTFIVLKNKLDTYGEADEALKKLKHYYTVKVLYIDDFLKVGRHIDAFNLIDSRYKQGLITIISSEIYLEDITDEGIYSRIYQMCNGNVVRIEKHESKNYRLFKNK